MKVWVISISGNENIDDLLSCELTSLGPDFEVRRIFFKTTQARMQRGPGSSAETEVFWTGNHRNIEW